MVQVDRSIKLSIANTAIHLLYERSSRYLKARLLKCRLAAKIIILRYEMLVVLTLNDHSMAGCLVADEDLRCQLKQAADQQTIALTITCVSPETPCRGV